MKSFSLINERHLLWIIYGVASLILAIPLVIHSDFYFPFITARNFVFRIAVELLVLAYVVLVLQNRKYLPARNPVVVALAVFAAVMTVTSLLSGSFMTSLWSNFERMDGLITLYHLFALVIVLYGTLRTHIEWERLLQTSIFISLVVALVGLSQILGVNLLLASSGGERISSTLGNATYLASYLLIHIFLAVYFLAKQRERQDLVVFKFGFIVLDVILVFLQIRFGLMGDRQGILGQIFSNIWLSATLLLLQALALSHFFKNHIEQRYVHIITNIFYYLLIGLYLVIISTTQTRGALVGLFFGVTTAAVLLLVRRGESLKLRLSIIGLSLLMMVGVVTVMMNKSASWVQEQPLLQKIASISLSDATTQSRLATWQSAFKGFADKPILGWGVENFEQVFNKYFPTVIYTDEGTPLWFDRPHNLLLQYLVEGGVIGIMSYLVLLGLAVVFLFKRQRSNYIGIVFISFLAAYIGQNLFVFDSVNSYVPFYVTLAFIAYLISRKDQAGYGQVSRTAVGVRTGMAVFGIATIAIIGTVWVCNIKPAQANYRFVAAYREISQDYAQGTYNSTRAEDIFAILDQAPYLGKAELTTVFSDTLVSTLQKTDLTEAEATELSPTITKTAERLEAVVEQNPRSARLNVFLMNLYLNAASALDRSYAQRVVSLAEKTIPLSPERPHIYYLSGRAYMMQKEYDKGIATFEHAVAIAPQAYEAHWNLFAAYVTVGNKDKASQELELLRTRQEFNKTSYYRSAMVYASTKMWDEAAAVLQKGLVVYPDSYEFYAALADIYLQQNKFAEARASVAKAVELNPELKDQADSFLKTVDAKQGKK